MKKRHINIFFIYFIFFLFEELVFRIFCADNFFSFSLVSILLNIIFLSSFWTLITYMLRKCKINFIHYIIIGLYTFLFLIEVLYKKILGVFFTFKVLGMSNNLISFIGDVIKKILSNSVFIIIILIPIILILFYREKINIKINNIFIVILSMIISFSFYRISFLIDKNRDNSIYSLYYKIDNMSLYKEKMGVLSSLELEIKRGIFGFENQINKSIDKETASPEEIEVPKKVLYNNLDIDFSYFATNETDSTLKKMHNYFKDEEGTKQNDYTGIYKGKNLILFMAESFNSIAVDKTLTPTLYKLTNSGFVFENFYSPVILSTIGGEFQELTGLYPDLSLLSRVWRKGNNNYQFGYANIFKNMGYDTYAYHDSSYNFQDRDKYLKSIGFDNYTGCSNGLEARINCNLWPASDLEMIDATFDDYANNENPFLVYYVTVSGHMGYTWNTNQMAKKNRDYVDSLEVSLKPKAYLAAQIELDRALELLIKKLEEKDLLDDTVIALVGDHYPYDLSINEINEISTYERDKTFEINRSNFILWNNKQETVKVDKIGSQIDVLPTILNVFGANYDSRMIIGNDILSDSEGLAIFDNFSWISDYGRYNSATNKFTKKSDDIVIDDDYISKMNNKVYNKVNMSKLLLENNYYSKMLEKIK